MTNEVVNFCMFIDHCTTRFVNCLFQTFACYVMLSVFLIVESSLYIMDIRPSSDMCVFSNRELQSELLKE